MSLMRTILHAHLLAGVSGVECEGNIECPPTSALQPRGLNGSAPEEHHGLQLHTYVGPTEAPEDKTRKLRQRTQVRIHVRPGRHTRTQLKKHPFLKLLNWKDVGAVLFSILIHGFIVGLYSLLAKFQLLRYYKWVQKAVEQLDGGGKGGGTGQCAVEIKELFLRGNSKHNSEPGIKFLQPIPDLSLDSIGQAENGTHPIAMHISDWLVICIQVIGIVAILATGDARLIARHFIVATFLALLNIITENLTILPPSIGVYNCLVRNKICDTEHYITADGEDCIAYRNRIGKQNDPHNYKDITTISQLLGQLDSVHIGVTGTCTAMVFSGHTYRMMLFTWFFFKALREFNFKWVTEPVILVAMFAVGLIQAGLILVNFDHYSVDIFLSFVLTFAFTHFEPLMKFGVWLNPFIY